MHRVRDLKQKNVNTKKKERTEKFMKNRRPRFASNLIKIYRFL